MTPVTPLLLDTHVMVWLLRDMPSLGPIARTTIGSAPQVYVSAASFWELAIKASLGKGPDIAALPEAFRAAGLSTLPISPEDALAILGIRFPHRDPFDQLLVAQAETHSAALMTADRTLLSAGLSGVIDARH